MSISKSQLLKSQLKISAQQAKHAIYPFDSYTDETLALWTDFIKPKSFGRGPSYTLSNLITANLPAILSLYGSHKIDQITFDNLIIPLYKRCSTKEERSYVIGVTARACLDIEQPSLFVDIARLYLSMEPVLNISNKSIKYAQELISRHDLFNAMFITDVKNVTSTNTMHQELKSGLSSIFTRSSYDILKEIELRTMYIESFIELVSDIYATRIITDHFNKYDGLYFHKKLKETPANEEVNYITHYFFGANNMRSKWRTLASPEQVINQHVSWLDFINAPKWTRVCEVHHWNTNRVPSKKLDIFQYPSFDDILDIQTESQALEKIRLYRTMGIQDDKAIVAYLKTSVIDIENNVAIPEVGHGF